MYQGNRGSLSPKSAIVLMMAMAVHSLFETMALGLANDKTSAILMATSIGLHQPAESIALLVAFLKTSMPRKDIMKWYVLIFIYLYMHIHIYIYIYIYILPTARINMGS
jgi:zinc transporter ZupT